jgi:hypothetical protein
MSLSDGAAILVGFASVSMKESLHILAVSAKCYGRDAHFSF